MNLPLTIESLDETIPFKKHSATIHMEGQLSFIDHKMLNILYKCAFEKDSCGSETYYVKISDIVNYLGWKRNVKHELTNALKQLRTSGINYNIFGQDKLNDDDWKQCGQTGFISEFNLNDDHNFISFSLSPLIRSMLKKPNIYAFIDIRIQKLFNSRYELILYEYFVEDLYRNRTTDMITRWYSIDDIRRMFNIPDDQYQDFKILNRNCITRPIKSINSSKSGLFVEVNEVQRIGRKIVAMNFHIELTDKSKMDNIQEVLPLEVEDSVINEIQYEAQKELLLLFQSQKTVNDIVKELSTKYDNIDLNLYIINNIEYAKKVQNRGAVDNFLGYLRTCLVNDYANYIKNSEKQNRVKEKEEEIQMKKALEEKISIESSKLNMEEYNKLPEAIKATIHDKCKKDVYMWDKLNTEIQKMTEIEYYIRNKTKFINIGAEK